jgi:hypothetical protein
MTDGWGGPGIDGVARDGWDGQGRMALASAGCSTFDVCVHSFPRGQRPWQVTHTEMSGHGSKSDRQRGQLNNG